MSMPEGCKSAGNSLLQSSRSGQPACTAHEMEESIHVSKTSRSGINSRLPHFGHLSILGFSSFGSIGTHSSFATIISPQFLQYHMGIGVPNTRWRLITQSQSRERAQSTKRVFMLSGYHAISLAVFSTLSVKIRVFINHCLRSRISTGVSHRSHTPISC